MGAASIDDFKLWLSSTLAEERQQILEILEARHTMLLEDANSRLGNQFQNSSREREGGCAELSPAISRQEEPDPQEPAKESIVAVPQSSESSHDVPQRPKKKKFKNSTLSVITEELSYSNTGGWIPLPDTARFEIIFGVVILINAILVCLEIQNSGKDIGYKLGYKGFTSGGNPGFWNFFQVGNFICNIMFTVELVLRLLLTKQPWKSRGIWIDLVIVPIAWLEVIRVVTLNTTIIRVFRLARTVRVVKILHTMSAFKVLYFMLRSLVNGVQALFWSFVLIASIHTCAALFFCQMLVSYLKDDSQSEQDRLLVFRYGGTFSRAFFTMYEISDANWVSPARHLMERVDPSWAVFFLLYRCVLFYAFGKVIAAVFITETQRLLTQDAELLVEHQKVKTNEFQNAMWDIFEAMDVNHDRMVSKRELEEMAQRPEIIQFCRHLDLDGSHFAELIEILDAGDGTIHIDAFIKGLPKLKGVASSIEMGALRHNIQNIASDVAKLRSQSCLSSTVDSVSRHQSSQSTVAMM